MNACRNISCIIYPLLMVLVGWGCKQSIGEKSEQAQEEIFPQTPAEFTQVEIKYAQNFSVSYHQDYKLVHVYFSSEDRETKFDQKIVIYQKGTSKPELTGELANAWAVEAPLETIAANDDGEITRLKALGLLENIVAMGGGGIYDEELRKRWEEKKIASIGYSFHRPPQPEIILSLNPDILFLYAYDHQRLESVEKLRQLGINAIPQFAWAETSMLGKAEWLKFSALFFNREKEANDLFDSISTQYHKLVNLTKDQPSRIKAFATYFPSGESDWSAHRNDFFAHTLEASGAENVLKDEGPNHLVGINNEQLLALAKDADAWLVNSTSDEDWPPSSYLESFKAYQNDQVYHYQKRTRYGHDAYDWYETPEVRPDLVLKDLVAIFYPDLLEGHELIYFEKIKVTKRK